MEDSRGIQLSPSFCAAFNRSVACAIASGSHVINARINAMVAYDRAYTGTRGASVAKNSSAAPNWLLKNRDTPVMTRVLT